jgi:hypothetical protein
MCEDKVYSGDEGGLVELWEEKIQPLLSKQNGRNAFIAKLEVALRKRGKELGLDSKGSKL